MSDLIDRQAAIDELWKALFEYEDKTEKQFQESEDLDLRAWMVHRIFVQNMSDIDRQTILNMPPSEPRWIPVTEQLPEEGIDVLCCFRRGEDYKIFVSNRRDYNYWSGIGRTGDNVAWMPLPEPWKGGES